jgi:Zn-dependent protease with chaperone function
LEHVKVDKGIYIRHHIDQELQADARGARLLAGVYPTSNALAESIHAFLNELPKESLQPKEPNTAAITAAATTNPAQQTVAVAAVSYDIVKTPLDQHPNSEERRQRLECAYEEIVRNGHESHLAAEK